MSAACAPNARDAAAVAANRNLFIVLTLSYMVCSWRDRQLTVCRHYTKNHRVEEVGPRIHRQTSCAFFGISQQFAPSRLHAIKTMRPPAKRSKRVASASQLTPEERRQLIVAYASGSQSQAGPVAQPALHFISATPRRPGEGHPGVRAAVQGSPCRPPGSRPCARASATRGCSRP